MKMTRRWLDNAFWETPRKHVLNAILEEDLEDGKKKTQVYKVDKFNSDGTENEVFLEIVEFLGEEKIEASTERRMKRKAAEADAEKQRKVEEERARNLEKLFKYKLETFEIEEIKNSKNRVLKSKLRRSKSIPEVNLYAIMIVKEVIDNAESN
jgi:serine phosphatase RsbU (regulator of sigma subunit)